MGYPSGQRDQTVNLTAMPSKVRILPPPPINEGESYIICFSLLCAGIVQW